MLDQKNPCSRRPAPAERWYGGPGSFVQRCCCLCIVLLLAACDLRAAPAPTPAPTQLPAPTSAASPTLPPASATPALTATPAPTPTLPAPEPLASADQQAPLIGLGPLDPDASFVPLLRQNGALELLALRGETPAGPPLRGSPVGWSFDAQLFAYLDAGSGNIDALAPTFALTTTVVSATAERQPLAAGWMTGLPLLLYAVEEQGAVVLRAWNPRASEGSLFRLPDARLADISSLPVNSVENQVAVPLLRGEGESLQRELVLVDLVAAISVTLTTAPGPGPMVGVWSPRGQLAYSFGAGVAVYLPARSATQLVGAEGLPLDWTDQGLLIVEPSGQLLRWREDVGLERLQGGAGPLRATYAPDTARWAGRLQLVALHEGAVYRALVLP